MSTNNVTRRNNGTTMIDGIVAGRIERRVEPFGGGTRYAVRWYVYNADGVYITAHWSLRLAKDSLASHARYAHQSADVG
jgi:hypothetical protein